MVLDHERKQNGDGLKYLPLRATANALPAAGDEDTVADVDEPPDHRLRRRESPTNFHRSAILPQNDRQHSLITQALHTGHEAEMSGRDIYAASNIARRRSTISNASTADLTSDESITSPARTNTPSPPIPKSSIMNLVPYLLGRKPAELAAPVMVQQDPKESVIAQLPTTSAQVSRPDPAVEALVKKRCITFACGGQKFKPTSPPTPKVKVPTSSATVAKIEKAVPKRCTIKFACTGPKHEEKVVEPLKQTSDSTAHRDLISVQKSQSRIWKCSPPPNEMHGRATSTVTRVSQSPPEQRSSKAPGTTAPESIHFSKLTRFHEFASDELEEDDWIMDTPRGKGRLTINDTLMKENAIRQLGKEVDDEDEEDDNDDEDEEETVDNDGLDDETIDGSDLDASDGNETDNEEGFAESDEEGDAVDDYDFWTPEMPIRGMRRKAVKAFRSRDHIAASESSIDSGKSPNPIAKAAVPAAVLSRQPKRSNGSRRIKIRPGTPDLPDSTDFVCGTLDEDRPVEDAYLSCIKARSRGKHHPIPQDIDPSFPASEPEVEVGDAADDRDNSEEHVWLHGKFEDSDDEPARRHKHSTRKSPVPSPKRLHSPPPPKHRLRSPPPRRLFGGQSPRRLRSPAPDVKSPAATPSSHAKGIPLAFAALGHRPGLTHTKSLPRTPNPFDLQYRAARLAAANATSDADDTAGGHTRGAIDIVKGLEHKRQRRKEKHFHKLCNRARKGQAQKKPQPGTGAERMRDLGLQLAGKNEERHGKAEYVISL